jgi:ABC-2 type transport system permease protein
VSARRAIWAVARRELVERSRTRALRISTALILLVSVGGAVAAARLTGRTPTDDVGLVGARAAALGPAIQAQARVSGRRARVRVLASVATATRDVRSGTIDIAVIDGSRLVVKSSASRAAVRVVRAASGGLEVLRRVQAAGLSPAAARSALALRPLPVTVLEPESNRLKQNREVLSIGLIALLMVLVFYGQAVAQGVTEEKSSRVVELLLTTVSPRRLLTGKVAGIGLLGLGQLVVAGVAALVAGKLAGGAGLPSAAPQTVALVMLWFALGYVFYSVAFAGAGALVSRQEDLTAATTPITILLLGAFYLALITGFDSPNGTAATIAAYVPPLAPMVVPARMVLGDMSVIGLIGAVAVDLVATAGVIVLAARVYERSILQVGAPVKLRRALRASTR